jgi:hypothetical protein
MAVHQRVVNFSGGVGSWAAARRVADRYGTEGLTLLFADTRIEDQDLYRFIQQAAADVGGTFVRLRDGRTPWEVFHDERYLGNSRTDPCSKLLKRVPLDRWRVENCDPAHTTLYIGIDWTEVHRLDRLRPRIAPWQVEAPMTEAPYLSKQQMLEALSARGIKPPRLYEMGFPHNNCGGGCVKAGQAHFAHLLKMIPKRYAEWEREEQKMRDYLERDDIAILRDRTGGKSKPLSLKVFRERVQQGELGDQHEWGGCGCALDDGEGEP